MIQPLGGLLAFVACVANTADTGTEETGTTRSLTDTGSKVIEATGATGGTAHTADTGTTGGTTDTVQVTNHPLLGIVVSLPGGTFLMGAEKGDLDAFDDEFPQHEVTLSGFTVMEREVSQTLYQEVTGVNPSFFAGCDDCPVDYLSYLDAEAFAAAVSAETGEPWRLPTEAEWEYAARGAEDYLYAGSGDLAAVGWTSETAGGETHPGCSLARNGYLLCDMTGNVMEWTADWYGAYTADAVADPTGPDAGKERVQRGGAYGSSALLSRTTYRREMGAYANSPDWGVRLVKSDP